MSPAIRPAADLQGSSCEPHHHAVAEANRALSEWQRANLRLAWVEHPLPWAIEREVISVLGPPLNLAGNASHEMHGWLRGRRARLRGTSLGGE